MHIANLSSKDFQGIIELSDAVLGKNYTSTEALQSVLEKSCKEDLNSSFVVYDGETLAGFRLTLAPGKWEIDKWFAPEKWGVDPTRVCLFKANTIHPGYQARGLGGLLLNLSAQVARQQGAVAGVAHVWMQSPGNAAYNYFLKSGGREIGIYPDRWKEDYEKDGYLCIIHGSDCSCDGAEMILYFKE